MRKSLSIALIAVVSAGVGGAWVERAAAEDMQLRARAVQLLDKARATNAIRGGPYSIQTDASFVASGDAGAVGSGSYLRTRGTNGSLRQEIQFADWQATMIFSNSQVGMVGPWEFPPYAVRRLLSMVPFSVGQFDDRDVVRAIRDGGAGGQAATCIDYDTIRGEEKTSNEICVSKADGTLLEMHDRGRTYEYSKYADVVGSKYPQHIEYQEDSGFRFSADVTMTKLEKVSDDLFVIPSGAKSGTLCKTGSAPVPVSAPQPEAKGGPDAPVVDVVVRVFVTDGGAVVQPHMMKAGRADLDDAAMKLVQTWTFEPATCNGKANTVPRDLVVHYQGH
jgi:Gram-negative bacterial TonB protein C-terminal